MKKHFKLLNLNALGDFILKPGDLICQLFKVEHGEPRYFLRLYLNIFIYTKIAVCIAVYLAVSSSRL